MISNEENGGSAPALTHVDESGKARMVDISGKPETARKAVARCRIMMDPNTLALIQRGEGPKGEVFGVARVAAIMGAKGTSSLIPMCHPIALTGIDVDFATDDEASAVDIQVTVRTQGRTGAEMEALCGAAVAALTVYDMCKAVDKSMTIGPLRLVFKSGGKSGAFCREDGREEEQ
ncbi:MAG: cyclic pyranopterin monophosphate synthase MoaC [Clostridia bacterium]|nr:cyclic pyranopterin monophosphate synthase MoaC [Clostridia bacterium]